MPEETYASLFEEFEAFWKEVKEGGKIGEYEHFRLDDFFWVQDEHDYFLGIKMDGIERDIFRQAKESIVAGIMENGPYTGHGSKIAGSVLTLISNASFRVGYLKSNDFKINDWEPFYTRSSVFHTYLRGGQMLIMAQCTDSDKKDFVGVALTFWRSDLDLKKAGENMGIIVRAIDDARKHTANSHR